MENPIEMSRKQLELQARIAQRRIEAIEAILTSGVQAPVGTGQDNEASEVIARLYDTSLSEADVSSCIKILEMLLLVEGLPPLLSVMKRETYRMRLRQEAARAISVIGCKYIEDELRMLLASDSPDLRYLAEVALGNRAPTCPT